MLVWRGRPAWGSSGCRLVRREMARPASFPCPLLSTVSLCDLPTTTRLLDDRWKRHSLLVCCVACFCGAILHGLRASRVRSYWFLPRLSAATGKAPRSCKRRTFRRKTLRLNLPSIRAIVTRETSLAWTSIVRERGREFDVLGAERGGRVDGQEVKSFV